MKMNRTIRIPRLSARPLQAAGIGVLFALSFTLPFTLVNQQAREIPAAITANDKTFYPSAGAAAGSPALPPVPTELEPGPAVAVFRTALNRTDQVPLEYYVQGVIAAEMPESFEPEALKAQAIASRTYIVKRLSEGTAAGLSDTVKHQVFVPIEEVRKNRPSHARKIEKAVLETQGLILTYQGKPIEASFFSTSNGQTENSEDYWTYSMPYLRSVPSPWDKDSPKFKSSKRMPLKEFAAKLGLSESAKTEFANNGVRVLSRTEGGSVAKVSVGGQEYTGRRIRELLELPSASFTIRLAGESQVEILTEGYGHGVGMSQYGANGMAKEGKQASDILAHYYQNTKLEYARAILPNHYN